MLFMVIEHFRNRDAVAVYRHLRDRGRGLPDGLTYVDGWVSSSFDRCFQLMECDDPAVLQQWVLHWGDVVEVEFVPVAPSVRTRELLASYLDERTVSPS